MRTLTVRRIVRGLLAAVLPAALVVGLAVPARHGEAKDRPLADICGVCHRGPTGP